MPDEADLANETADRMLQEALNYQTALSKNPLRPTGLCYYCQEPTEAHALFCDPGCRQDYDEEERLKKRLTPPPSPPRPTLSFLLGRYDGYGE